MATEITICSNALLMLGANPINSFDDANDRARLASNLWPFVRDYVLRRHPWNCAVRRVKLAPDAAAPDFGYSHQFTLPEDFLRAISIGEDGSDDYKVESGKLLCNENPVLLRYIWRNEQPETWDAMLVWGMTVAMKAVLAYPTTQSTSMEQLIEAALKDTLKQARAVDGQEEPPETFGDSPLLAARGGFTRSR